MIIKNECKMLNFIKNYLNQTFYTKAKVLDVEVELFQEKYKDTMVKISSQTACSTEIPSMEDLLKTSMKEGLSSKEVSHRQRLYGGNDFDIGEETPLWKKYLLMVKYLFTFLFESCFFVA